jgi:hypothetical protein
VVLAVAVLPPFAGTPVLAVPLLARLHLPGKGQPGCVELAARMLAQVLEWFPDRRFTLVGDGAYASEGLLKDLDARVEFVGRMRGDAAVYDPRVPAPVPKRRGRKAKKGPRMPSPKAAAELADRVESEICLRVWQAVEVTVYGCRRALLALAYEVVWPTVLGLRPVRVVVVRDPEGSMKDCYLFTTDRAAGLEWAVTQFAWRWSVEVLFRSSKQVLEVEGPQHWCRASVEKVAPWVWAVQAVLMVWYVTAGRESPEGVQSRALLGDWDSEWSLRHMLRVLRKSVVDATICPDSAEGPQLQEMVRTLKNWADLAA